MKIRKSSLHEIERVGLRTFCAGGLLLSSFNLSVGAEADKDVQDLEESTVFATRIKTDLDKVGNSVSILDAVQLDREGVRQLDDALKLVPGVNSDTSSGQRGTTSSLFIRGNASKYSGVIIDGFRMDGSGGFSTGTFYGIGGTSGLSKIEVLKGPQGVLYGASSVSGVLGLSTAKGAGDYRGSLRFEAGSFDSYYSSFGMQGSSGKLSYSMSLGREKTDNDLPNSEFYSNSYQLRLDYDVSERLRFGLTTRGVDTQRRLPVYSDPSYPRNSDAEFDSNLSTIFSEYDLSDVWSSKLTLGYYDENYATYNPNAGDMKTYSTDANKFAAYWDNTLVWGPQHSTAAGISYEDSEYKNLFLSRNRRKQTGLYVNHVWDVTDALHVSGGLRWTDYEEDAANGFKDDVTTCKVAGSYKLEATNTIFRASMGSGFQLPTYYEVYNKIPNNVLDPVESVGWDFGVEQEFNDGQLTLGATYFETRIDNTIDYLGWDSGALYGNRDAVNETSGVEVFAKASFLDERVTASLSYTWLNRQTLVAPSFLPEHTGSVRVNYKATEKWNIGMSSTYQGHRALFGESLPDYALVNLYTDYKVNDKVTLSARIDNVLDKEYHHSISPAFGGGENVRPGSGFGFFGGATIHW